MSKEKHLEKIHSQLESVKQKLDALFLLTFAFFVFWILFPVITTALVVYSGYFSQFS